MSRPSKRPDPQDIAAEIVRRANGAEIRPRYVIRISDPPTPHERLQLLAAQLQRTPVAVVPHKCKTTEEWIAHHTVVKDVTTARCSE